MMNAPLPDLYGEHWPKPGPPQTHRLVTNIDATFEQNVFNLAQRKRIADVHHHREANDLGRTVEITAGVSHHSRLEDLPWWLKPIYSDNAYEIEADSRQRPRNHALFRLSSMNERLALCP